jgi:class 3 adenylate cyclase
MAASGHHTGAVMNWDFERSKERLAKEWARIQEAGLNIQRLTREMDLANLSPTDARIVHGAHIYCHIANFSEFIDSPLMRRDDFKRLHRLLHVLRIEQRHALQQIFGGDKIQIQGPKFHGLLYKPYDDDPALAWKSVLVALALKLIGTEALPMVFPEYPKLKPSLGLSIGDCLVANIGARGERELISVGAAANYAAKIMSDVQLITISSDLYSSLNKERQKLFMASGRVYVLDSTSVSNPSKLLRDEGYAWDAETSSARMAKTRDGLSLDEINSSEAQVRIDFDLLGPKNVKTCSGASVFVDIDGYTAAIDGLFKEERELGKALQWLHLFRYEMRHVTVDKEAVPVQHQGDRLQALSHVPSGDEASAMRRAVDLSIDCNSSMEEVLNEYHADLGKLHVAIGAAFGKTVAVRSGVRGDLDAGCLGKEVGRAERLQLRSPGGQITISKELYEVLDDEVIRQEFVTSDGGDTYVAKGLTWTKVEDLRKIRNYGAKKSVGFDRTTSGIVFGIGTSQAPGVAPLKQTRPWGIE